MKSIEAQNSSKNVSEKENKLDNFKTKLTSNSKKRPMENSNFEKEKMCEVVRLLSEENINITPLKVRKFIFKELDPQAVSKRIVKVVSQVEELKRKAEEDARKIWVD